MNRQNLFILLFFSFLLFSCAVESIENINSQNNSELTLEENNKYFSLNGTPQFLYGRNVTGYLPEHYTQILGWQGQSSGRIMRVHVTHGFGMGMDSEGQVNPEWLAQWDSIFDEAAEQGIFIIPVFGVWADWNDEPREWSNWDENPLNSVNGGPGTLPGELFSSSDTQMLWLQWVASLVAHWDNRWNIAAWEVFSEVDLVSGTDEAQTISFIKAADAVISSVDSKNRPLTASLASGLNNYPNLFLIPELDIVQIHLYWDDLDIRILEVTSEALWLYGKPVLIGESGLSAYNPEPVGGTSTTFDRAEYGINHAIWAAIVSGAMNGRSLWWEDSYAIYHSTLGMPFLENYSTAEKIAASFTDGMDFSGFQQQFSEKTEDLYGQVIGNGTDSFVGWFRDINGVAPDWPIRTLSDQTFSINSDQSNTVWKIQLIDPANGNARTSFISSYRNEITVYLPEFSDSIACKLQPAATEDLSENILDNGDFSRGTTAWSMISGNGATGSISVSENELLVTGLGGLTDPYENSQAKWDITVDQTGIVLNQGCGYNVGFTAKTDSSRNIALIITENGTDINGDGNAYSWFTPAHNFTLSEMEQEYSFTFFMQYPDINDALLRIAVGESNVPLTISNIAIRRCPLLPVAANENMILNGDFSANRTFWENWMEPDSPYNAHPVIENGYLHYRINNGGPNYLIELSQGGLFLEANRQYILQYRAWADADRDIYIAVDENGLDRNNDGNLYTQYLANITQSISTTPSLYTHEFSSGDLSDFNAKVKFFVGGDNADVYLDDISLVLAE